MLRATSTQSLDSFRPSKVVRELTMLGLKESKDLVESAPKLVKEKVTKEEATTAKEKLEAAGAGVEIS